MYHLFFVCIWLKHSIFGEFSTIYLLSAQNRVKWRHKIRPIAKNFWPILILFARDDAKLMPGEVCQVSCRYSNKWRSYSWKTEGGGSDPTPPPPGGGGLSLYYINCFVSRRATRSFFPRSSSSIRGETARGVVPTPNPLCRGRMRNGLCRRGVSDISKYPTIPKPINFPHLLSLVLGRRWVPAFAGCPRL